VEEEVRIMPWGIETLDKLNNFIANAPLYSQLDDLGEFMDPPSAATPQNVLSLNKVYRWCPNTRCKTERPFDLIIPAAFHKEPPGAAEPEEPGGVYSLSFRCTWCGSDFHCFLEVNPQWREDPDQKLWVRKVGEAPRLDLSLDLVLEEALGGDAELYKRAVDCRTRGYGLGACAYLRRVIEHQIDPILRLILEVKKDEGAEKSELDKIRKTIEGKSFADKARLAYQVAPGSIVVEGSNPLKIIHDELSGGVHRLGENEALEVANELSRALEFVVRELNRQRTAKAEYAKTIKAAHKKTR